MSEFDDFLKIFSGAFSLADSFFSKHFLLSIPFLFSI